MLIGFSGDAVHGIMAQKGLRLSKDANYFLNPRTDIFMGFTMLGSPKYDEQDRDMVHGIMTSHSFKFVS